MVAMFQVPQNPDDIILAQKISCMDAIWTYKFTLRRLHFAYNVAFANDLDMFMQGLNTCLVFLKMLFFKFDWDRL